MRKCLLWMGHWLVCCLAIQAQDHDVLDEVIHLPKLKGTTYEILNLISERSGYMFMYDSKMINSNRNVRIPAGKYHLKDAINRATGESIQIKIIGQHILLYKTISSPDTQPESSPPQPSPNYLTIEGSVKDKENNEPIPYCSVSIAETSIGTITNQNGMFLLKVPNSLSNAHIHISHIGYETQQFPARILAGNKADLYLTTRYIPLEAVIINLSNPQKIIRDMMENRSQNYTSNPFYLTTFYREGIERKRGFSNLSEAVFRIYKPGYNNTLPEQVKLVKMRTISNNRETDTVIMKMKAGVNATLMLDVIKNIPDFFILNKENMYHYTKIDMTVMDEHLAHVIAFEQKSGIDGPLYKGELYIDEKNSALLHAHFRINPDYIKQARSMLVVKKSRNMDIIPEDAVYSVSYQQWNGKYYINHVRGDLYFKVKKKKFLSGSTSLHTYFEMVTCKIDTLNVKRFPARESQPTYNIFSETNYTYDESFWENFNVIMPEEKLNEAISRITPKIEENVEK